jgi:hypothetical protein
MGNYAYVCQNLNFEKTLGLKKEFYYPPPPPFATGLKLQIPLNFSISYNLISIFGSLSTLSEEPGKFDYVHKRKNIGQILHHKGKGETK